MDLKKLRWRVSRDLKKLLESWKVFPVAIRVEAIAIRVEAITRLEAIAIRLEVFPVAIRTWRPSLLGWRPLLGWRQLLLEVGGHLLLGLKSFNCWFCTLDPP